jgi:ubiquitin thioesterase OTU1
MRARYKGPAGTGTIEIEDTASIQDLFDEVRAKTGIQEFTIKYGLPMAMKTLEPSDNTEIAKDLGLHGETLTIVPQESRPPALSSTTQSKDDVITEKSMNTWDAPSQTSRELEDIVVPWPEREGTLCKSSESRHHIAY